jgi:mono/diheme cytochrome c family protein
VSAKHFRALALAALPAVFGACEWFTDFKQQPAINTWEAVAGDTLRPSRANPQLSVPTTGVTKAAYEVSLSNRLTAPDSFETVPNPNPPTDASIASGHKYYQINCAVCHGDAGGDPNKMGDGPVAIVGIKYGFAPTSLNSPAAVARTDGYIYGIIRNGRGNMPSYSRIEESDRWDVVNYVRGLQGRLGKKVAVGPLAPPGVTGDKVPGPTRMAPTRPSQFFNRHKGATAPAKTDSGAVKHDTTAAEKKGGSR